MASSPLLAGAKYRVFIVDDHPLVRSGLRAVISAQEDLEVCGEAASLVEAIRFVEQSPADAVVLDLSLKDCRGLTGLGELLRHAPRTRILVCSCYDEKLYAERVLHAGAMGYVQKCEQSDSILEAIRRVVRGEVYTSRRLANRLLGRLGNSRQAEDALASLSDREFTVFESLGRGLTIKQIAGRLFVSTKTIESHRENIKRKLMFNTSAELNWYAMRWVLEARETAQAELPSTTGADLPNWPAKPPCDGRRSNGHGRRMS